MGKLRWLGVGLLCLLPLMGLGNYPLHLVILCLLWGFVYTGWAVMGRLGMVSLGHGAFLGIGAYVNAVLLAQGVPFLVTLPLAGVFTALCGAAIGRPTLRMSGLYLAIATLAFGSIVGTVFQKWTAVTGGFDGFAASESNVSCTSDSSVAAGMPPVTIRAIRSGR